MCGIVAYLGNNSYKEFIINGLKLLQNRGYDSTGVCSIHDGSLNIVKFASTQTHDALLCLEEKINAKSAVSGICIGHTRWATHGSKTTINAHPHTDHAKRVAIVHNGIIENYLELKTELSEKGFTFVSQTDSEVISILIGSYLDTGCNMKFAIQNTIDRLVGTWALAIIHVDYPEKLWITRNGSPLLLGLEEDFVMVASEQIAFNNYIKRYITLDNNDLIEITRKGKTISYSQNVERYVINTKKHANIELTPAGYSHWMIKEIMEQPDSINRTLNNGGRIDGDMAVKLGGLDSHKYSLLETNHLIILGCGTSLNAGVWSLNTFKSLNIFDTVVCYDGAEFTTNDVPRRGKTCVIMLSQSGETADLYQCMQITKKHEMFSIGIVNVVDSMIAKETDCGVYLNAGREVAVASTKSFSCQCVALALVAVWFSQNRGTSSQKRHKIIDCLRKLPFQIQCVLDTATDHITDIIGNLTGNSLFILGKGSDEAIAHESALKLKEIAYIHAEGYSSSALKHGPFAIIQPNLPIIIMDTSTEHRAKNVSACQEVLARGAYVILITDNNDNHFIHSNLYKLVVDKNEVFGGILANIYIQLISYHISLQSGNNPDYPRNLAKVVSV
jgi:glucosamine--fructose-6-phosphate aminotransferase (isomerizing)